MPTPRDSYELGDVILGNLRLIDIIREGGTGAVFLAENVEMNELKYAVKRLDKEQMEPIDFENYEREIIFMKKLSGHPNIVQYINNFETANHYYLVLEYCETDLFDAIFQRCGFPAALVKRFFADIANGLSHAHKNGIYHRDIKPENILITCGGAAKLADFGLSTIDKYTDDFGVGSRRYMAPECFPSEGKYFDSGAMIEDTCYNAPAADIWSAGILLVNMIFGRCPWNKASESDLIFKQYLFHDPSILKKKLHMSDQLDKFLKEKVFNMDPEGRCDIVEFNAFISSQEYFRTDDISLSWSGSLCDGKIVGIDNEKSTYLSCNALTQSEESLAQTSSNPEVPSILKL